MADAHTRVSVCTCVGSLADPPILMHLWFCYWHASRPAETTFDSAGLQERANKHNKLHYTLLTLSETQRLLLCSPV